MASAAHHSHDKLKYPITVAMTGASGVIYGVRLVETLLASGQEVDLLFTESAEQVMAHELGIDLREEDKKLESKLEKRFHHGGRLKYVKRKNWYAPQASGSSGNRPMVICPCSMGTLAAIAQGLSDNLIERAADVALKERRKLIMVPRETPLSEIHLENMLKLTRMGAIMMPAMPAFYNGAQKVDDLVDFLVARILDHLSIPHRAPKWGVK
uniref:Flavin prenyltransferase UbiX n=1 Tax=Magnetococcus massalia (strain MO-1) TaxID=451514 RepID=A0A1S7LKP1_MAGMO|nr:putative 3-polyprenyl-4-hydroxybenzoate decarboxylase [Candidatus Magnetococcus massalia]